LIIVAIDEFSKPGRFFLSHLLSDWDFAAMAFFTFPKPQTAPACFVNRMVEASSYHPCTFRPTSKQDLFAQLRKRIEPSQSIRFFGFGQFGNWELLSFAAIEFPETWGRLPQPFRARLARRPSGSISARNPSIPQGPCRLFFFTRILFGAFSWAGDKRDDGGEGLVSNRRFLGLA
jgi:hypothetical protein